MIIFLQNFLKNNIIETTRDNNTITLLEKLVKIKGKIFKIEKYRHSKDHCIKFVFPQSCKESYKSSETVCIVLHVLFYSFSGVRDYDEKFIKYSRNQREKNSHCCAFFDYRWAAIQVIALSN